MARSSFENFLPSTLECPPVRAGALPRLFMITIAHTPHTANTWQVRNRSISRVSRGGDVQLLLHHTCDGSRHADTGKASHASIPAILKLQYGAWREITPSYFSTSLYLSPNHPLGIRYYLSTDLGAYGHTARLKRLSLQWWYLHNWCNIAALPSKHQPSILIWIN